MTVSDDLEEAVARTPTPSVVRKTLFSIFENPAGASLKRIAWAYGCSQKGSAEEGRLLEILRDRMPVTRFLVLPSGGSVTLEMAAADVLNLSAEDRRFVFGLIDRMTEFERAHGGKGAGR